MRTPPISIKIFLSSLLVVAGTFFCGGTAVAQHHYHSLSASSTNLGFGSVQDGASKKISETLTNNGRVSVTISAAKVTGAGYSLSGLTLPTTLSTRQSYTFIVAFSPKTSGSSAGSITITSNAPQVSIALSGTGVSAGSLAASPTSISFGSVAVGTSKAATGTLTASGSSIVISSAGTNSAEYTMSGITLPMTLAAGKTVSFTLTFKPQSTGSAPATASFSSNAGNLPLQVILSGTGTTTGGTGSTPPHSVSLTWKSSTSSVAGYNVYRGTTTGGPYTKINSPVDTATAYTDNTVTAGATYYYVATGVNTNGVESTYSNEVKAAVPSP